MITDLKQDDRRGASYNIKLHYSMIVGASFTRVTYRGKCAGYNIKYTIHIAASARAIQLYARAAFYTLYFIFYTAVCAGGLESLQPGR